MLVPSRRQSMPHGTSRHATSGRASIHSRAGNAASPALRHRLVARAEHDVRAADGQKVGEGDAVNIGPFPVELVCRPGLFNIVSAELAVPESWLVALAPQRRCLPSPLLQSPATIPEEDAAAGGFAATRISGRVAFNGHAQQPSASPEILDVEGGAESRFEVGNPVTKIERASTKGCVQRPCPAAICKSRDPRPLGRGAAVDLMRAHVRKNSKEQGPAGRMFTPLRRWTLPFPDCVCTDAIDPAAWNDELMADTSHHRCWSPRKRPAGGAECLLTRVGACAPRAIRMDDTVCITAASRENLREDTVLQMWWRRPGTQTVEACQVMQSTASEAPLCPRRHVQSRRSPPRSMDKNTAPLAAGNAAISPATDVVDEASGWSRWRWSEVRQIPKTKVLVASLSLWRGRCLKSLMQKGATEESSSTGMLEQLER
eukprot:jgi/Tetstr1/455800/TSEL_042594.t1